MSEIVRIKTVLLVYVAIGSLGAIGQALWLRHELVDSYPFKVMGPLSYLYQHIGDVGGLISPAVAIAAIFMFRSARKYWLPVVPVVVCPLIFWLVFEYLSWKSSFSSGYMTQPQFEDDTGESVRLLFVRTSLILSAAGFVIGLACGKLISRAEVLILKATARKEFH